MARHTTLLEGRFLLFPTTALAGRSLDSKIGKVSIGNSTLRMASRLRLALKVTFEGKPTTSIISKESHSTFTLSPVLLLGTATLTTWEHQKTKDASVQTN